VGNAQVITEETFNSEVLKSSIPVLVDFTATWCGPCQRLAPIIEDLAAEYHGKVKVGKVDIDQCQEVASRFGIMSVPTVILFRDGKAVETMVGLNTKSFYKSRLDAMVGSVP
jgi:thioredoxin 1